ncbi:MAG TPA: MEKHLA domain-containing protein [Edaphobacter sp.]|jgi:PAS domain-containing protein|nr:MEKHLA domain-containing protein [Edaphobacter sp.]
MASSDLRFDLSFFRLLRDSYHRLTGLSLTPEKLDESQASEWLYKSAPFGVLAHNTATDPVFVYGNQTAQSLFGYSWDELTALPSRLSAEAPERGERQRFLEQVQRDGFVSGYSGIRITKDGRRFRIENATVWQLIDDHGTHHGQAAMLPTDAMKSVL